MSSEKLSKCPKMYDPLPYLDRCGEFALEVTFQLINHMRRPERKHCRVTPQYGTITCSAFVRITSLLELQSHVGHAFVRIASLLELQSHVGHAFVRIASLLELQSHVGDAFVRITSWLKLCDTKKLSVLLNSRSCVVRDERCDIRSHGGFPLDFKKAATHEKSKDLTPPDSPTSQAVQYKEFMRLHERKDASKAIWQFLSHTYSFFRIFHTKPTSTPRARDSTPQPIFKRKDPYHKSVDPSAGLHVCGGPRSSESWAGGDPGGPGSGLPGPPSWASGGPGSPGSWLCLPTGQSQHSMHENSAFIGNTG